MFQKPRLSRQIRRGFFVFIPLIVNSRKSFRKFYLLALFQVAQKHTKIYSQVLHFLGKVTNWLQTLRKVTEVCNFWLQKLQKLQNTKKVCNLGDPHYQRALAIWLRVTVILTFLLSKELCIHIYMKIGYLCTILVIRYKVKNCVTRNFLRKSNSVYGTSKGLRCVSVDLQRSAGHCTYSQSYSHYVSIL